MIIQETNHNRRAEDRLANEYADRFGYFGQHKIGGEGEFARIDRAFFDEFGIIRLFAEVKTCTYRFGQPSFGGGYKLNEEKVFAARSMHFATNCPVNLVVEFTDQLVQVDLLDEAARESGHQVYDRRRDTWQDAVMFPWPVFEFIRRLEVA